MTYLELIQRLQTIPAENLNDTAVVYDPYAETFHPVDLLLADESGNEMIGSDSRLYLLKYDWKEKHLFDESPLTP